MEAPIILVLTFFVPSVALAITSLIWGEDSRPLISDDHHR
jgi:hypothetical protein